MLFWKMVDLSIIVDGYEKESDGDDDWVDIYNLIGLNYWIKIE